MRQAWFLLLVIALNGCSKGAEGPNMSVILAEGPAQLLSDYGLFQPGRPGMPQAGVLPYDLINPLFSDFTTKDRLVFVPSNQKITYTPDEVLEFPVGTVLIKTFSLAADQRAPGDDLAKIETRVLIRKDSGWVAYPYVWSSDGRDAVYSPVGARHETQFIGPDGHDIAFTYSVPNQNQCKTCHALNGTLVPIGPKARNLNHVGPQGQNQLVDWQSRGILRGVPERPPSASQVSDLTVPLDHRARAYLDINCAHCHREGGSASNSGLWLQTSETSPVRLGIAKYPTAAGRGAGEAVHIISPGAPDQSILAYRMASTETGIAMPELGRALQDPDGVALVRAWIADMDPQPRDAPSVP